jgi:hypothetical protein
MPWVPVKRAGVQGVILLGRGPLLGIISVFQEKRGRKHVKFMFAWKTVRLFPTQTKRKHNTIIPSVFTQKWKTV